MQMGPQSKHFRKSALKRVRTGCGGLIPGVGLGLAIVKELCRVLEGELDFLSREGHGTTFVIQFPIELGKPVSRLRKP